LVVPEEGPLKNPRADDKEINKDATGNENGEGQKISG
jgi:hypothetical protein